MDRVEEAIDGFLNRSEEHRREMDAETFEKIEEAAMLLYEAEMAGTMPDADRVDIININKKLHLLRQEWEWEFEEGYQESDWSGVDDL